MSDWLLIGRWGWREWLLALLANAVFVTLANLAGAGLPLWFWFAASMTVAVIIDVAQVLAYRRTKSADSLTCR